jgi:hypothetical protein
VRWLLDLQNGDGGIPTFCRGWGALPFDRSAPDLTAHALRASKKRCREKPAHAASPTRRATKTACCTAPPWKGTRSQAKCAASRSRAPSRSRHEVRGSRSAAATATRSRKAAK